MVKTIKKKKKSKWPALIFILFLLASLVFLVFKICCSFGQSLWDGENQFNLAINSQPVAIVSFDCQEKKINILKIPDGTFIEVVHGYGPYRVESIYNLGEIKGDGGQLLADSLQEYLGLNIDGFLSGEKLPQNQRDLKSFLLNQFFVSLSSRGKTNLSLWDQLRLWWQTKMIREDKINLVDLSQTSASQEVDLPDGSRAMKIDQERLEKIISQFFLDERIKKEDLSVSILNKTEHLGLANKAARIIGNIGGRVIQIANQKQDGQDGRCQIKSEKKYKKSYTVKKLIKIFDCQWLEEKSTDQRTQINLYLGEDYWSKIALP
jgi:hypothetical protein